MPVLSFGDFVGETSTFYREYFDEQPMLRVGAVTSALSDLPNITELDDLLAMNAGASSYLRVSKDGRGLPHQTYMRTISTERALTQVIDPGSVYELFRSGATVTWNSVDHILPATRRLSQLFADHMSSETETAVFLTPAGHPGFAPHHDSIDVFVIQVEGTKAWRIWPRSGLDRQKERSYTPEELGVPSLEIVLSPGDVLYLPHGTPHSATARNGIAMHVSVGVTPRRWRHVLLETVEALLKDEAFDQVPAIGARRSGQLVSGFAAQVAALRDGLDRLDLTGEVGKLLGAGAERAHVVPGGEFGRLREVDALSSETVLTRTDLPVAMEPADDTTKDILVVGDVRLKIPHALADNLTALRPGEQLTPTQLSCGVPTARAVRAAQTLARLGLFDFSLETRRESAYA